MRVVIDKLGINGEGVARIIDKNEHSQKVCFIDFALPGEDVDFDILQEKSRFSIGKLNKIYKESSSRIEPKCKYFKYCGGCDIQHINDSVELEFKKQLVAETIKKIAKIDVSVADTISCEEFNYRNKMVFPVSSINGKARVGMFERNSHILVDIDKCHICVEEINRTLCIVRRWLKDSNYSGYDFTNCVGDIMYIVVRYHTNQLLVTVVVNNEVDLSGLYLALENHFEVAGVSQIISSHKSDILAGEYKHLYGKEYIDIAEFGVSYKIDNRGFLQVNNKIKEMIYNRVLDEINLDSNVIDAYSGAGLLSAIIANKAKSVVSIEINKSASDSAKKLFDTNNITNAKSICADVGNVIAEEVEKLDNLTIVLDPPRSGCQSGILQLINKYSDRINKVIYISCSPSTLARDLAILKERYIIDSVIPYNMFPKTKHVETLVCLQRLMK